MCLIITKAQPKYEYTSDQQDFVYGYKFLVQRADSISSPKQPFNWILGQLHQSSRTSTELTEQEERSKEVNIGFHFSTSTSEGVLKVLTQHVRDHSLLEKRLGGPVIFGRFVIAVKDIVASGSNMFDLDGDFVATKATFVEVISVVSKP